MSRINIVAKMLLEKRWADRFFTLGQLASAIGIERERLRKDLNKLCREGIAKRISGKRQPKENYGPGKPKQHILFRVSNKKALAEKLQPQTRGENNAFDRMWFVIRKKRVFTRRDLIILTEVKRETARWFVKMLRRAGIVAPSGPQSPEWRLIRDPGPKRPYVTNMKRGGGEYETNH